ncbi:MAG: hypothetical protein KAV45_03750 [Calditrichia bacterium]|nr:hypothetical protein [Calditrichia bacterium]
MNKEKNLAEINCNGEIFPNWQIFTYLAIINFLISFLASEFIFTRDFYYTIFSDQMELTRIDKYVDIIKRFSFWSLLLLPLFLLIRWVITALILQIPLLIRYIEISFKYIFRWVMFASIALTTGQIVYFLRIYFTSSENISRSLFKVQPLSLTTLINPEEYTSTAIVILTQFNLFDLFWGVILYIGLLKTGKIKKMDAFFLVLCVWVFLLFVQWAALFFLEKIR